MSERYEAVTGVRYSADPDKYGEPDAPMKDVAAGDAVDEYAVKQSPWLLDQGKVRVKKAAKGLVVTDAVKAKMQKASDAS
jgi:hypothetical protein